MLKKFLKMLEEDLLDTVTEEWAKSLKGLTEDDEDRIVEIYKRDLIKRQQHQQQQR